MRAVRSVLETCRAPIEINIFDNNSSDDTENVVRTLQRYDSRINYFRNKINIGSQGNYIKALNAVSTRYFVPLADDDFLLPGFLDEAHQIINRERDLGAVIFSTELHRDVRDSKVDVLFDKRQSFGKLRPDQNLREWLQWGYPAWSSALWSRSVLDEISYPYLHVGLPSDIDFQAQTFCRFPVYVCNNPGAVYFEHAGQSSRGLNVNHVRCWATLFSRFDHAVSSLSLFKREEYRGLRQSLWNRFRPVWSVVPDSIFHSKDFSNVIYILRNGLGDLDLADRLGEMAKSLDTLGVCQEPVTVSQVYVCNEEKAPIVSYNADFGDVVLWRAFGNVGMGFYVDVGPHDPITNSFTKTLYDAGWSGANLVFSNSIHDEFLRSRLRDVTVLYSVSNEESLLLNVSNDEETGWNCTRVPFEDFFFSIPERCIHFLRIAASVLGAERSCGADFHRFRPWVVVVETAAAQGGSSGDQPWRAALLAADYLPALSDGVNSFFVAREHDDLLPALQHPANSRDRFTTIAAVQAAEREAALRTELRAQVDAMEALRHTLSAAEADRARAAEAMARMTQQLAGLRSLAAEPPAPAAEPPLLRPPAKAALNRRLARFAYQLVRPLVRPVLHRLRGFMTAPPMAEIERLRHEVNGLRRELLTISADPGHGARPPTDGAPGAGGPAGGDPGGPPRE